MQPDLGRYIEERQVRLLVMSPLVSFLQEAGDYNKESLIRPELEKLQEVIEPRSCALLGLGHLNKRSGGDQTAIERVMGTVAFVNFVRSLLLVAWDDEEDCPRLMHAAITLTSRDDDLLVTLVNKNELHSGPSDRGPFVCVELQEAYSNVNADEALDRKSNKNQSKDQDGYQTLVLSWFRESKELTFTQIMELSKRDDVKSGTVKSILTRLVEDGDLIRPERGLYQLAPTV